MLTEKLKDHCRELEQENVTLNEARDTLTFEVNELKEELELLRNESDVHKVQIQEWENMISLVRADRDLTLTELEESELREGRCRKELEFLMASLHDALTERDTLQDEVFKLAENNPMLDELANMKSMIEELINDRNRLQLGLDRALKSKGEDSVRIEGLKRQLNRVNDGKGEHRTRERIVGSCPSDVSGPGGSSVRRVVDCEKRECAAVQDDRGAHRDIQECRK